MVSTSDLCVRSARWTAAILFAANGAIFGSLVPRLPELKATLEIGFGVFGLAMAAYPAGALLGGIFAGVVTRRWLDGTVSSVAMIVAALVMMALGWSPSVAAFAIILGVFGAADTISDVAMNAHALRVERMSGRALINSMHAVWSAGALLGAGVGVVAVSLGIPLRLQIVGVAGVAIVAVATGLSRILPAGLGSAAQERAAGGASGRRRWKVSPRSALTLILFGLVASAAELVEDFGQTWSALYLQEVLGFGPGLAGVAFLALQGSQLLGRLSGDRLVERYGRVEIARSGGVFVFCGSLLALVSALFGSQPANTGSLIVGSGVYLGLVACGWGIATIIPAAMVSADRLPGFADGSALTILNWMMRVALLVWPPLVGAIAERWGLIWILVPSLAAGAVLLAAAGSFRPQSSTETRPGGRWAPADGVDT